MAEHLHRGHRQRVKDRYLAGGIDVFSKHELVEFLLFFGIPQKDTNPIAHRLIDTFGTVKGILNADRDLLLRVEGMTPNAATLLNLVGDLRRYCAEEETPLGTCVVDTDDQVKLFEPKFESKASESVWMASLDHSSRVLAVHLVSKGTPVASDINVRDVLRYALSDNAVKIILAHNHPSGVAIPSETDLSTTTKLAQTLKAAGVTFEDHLIFARDGDCVSFRQSRALRDSLFGKVVPYFY